MEEISVGWRKKRGAEASPALASPKQQTGQQLGCVGNISHQIFGDSFAPYIKKPERPMFS